MYLLYPSVPCSKCKLLDGVHTISINVYFSITSLLVVLGKKVLFCPPFLVGLSFTDSSTVVRHTSDLCL